jgi:hypothetical protein
MSLGSCRGYSTRKRGLEGEWAGNASRFQAVPKRRASRVCALPIGVAAIPAVAVLGSRDSRITANRNNRAAPATVRVAES